MFRKRTPFNRKSVPAEPPHQSDHSEIPEPDSAQKTQEPVKGSNDDNNSPFLLEDSNVSFRRGLRDGTITNRVEPLPDPSLKHNKKLTFNLSFGDSLVENDFHNIHLRTNNRNRKPGKKRTRKGIDLCNTQKPSKASPEKVKNVEFQPEIRGHDQKEWDESMEDVELDETPEPSDHDDQEDVGVEAEPDRGEEETDSSDPPLYEISDDEGEIDMEKEISQIIKNSEDELEILKRNLNSTEDTLSKALERISRVKEEESELSREVRLYHSLAETSKTLVSLVAVKLPELSATLDRIKANRIDEAEYLLRMRRWLHCDLVRPFGIANLDYRCGELEDIDEMGKDLSVTISRTFENRVARLDELKQKFVAASVAGAKGLKYESLEQYLAPQVRELFTLSLGANYTLSQLTELYNYELAPEQVNLELMDDVTEEYASIASALVPFRNLRENSERLASFDFSQNLKEVFLFYAKMSILSWNPLKSPDPESLEWFAVSKEFDPNLISMIVDEALLLLALNCIEYFDIESPQESRNLAQFLGFVLRNSSQAAKSANVEKITSELLKSLQTKVSTLSLRLSSQDSPLTSLITDPVVLHVLKFACVRLASNLLCFSDILSNATLAAIVVDDLFLNKLLPLLSFESPLDAFVLLNFKAVTAPLSRHLQIKTKSNAILKLTYRRFCESEWAASDSEVFNALSVPMDRDEYSRLMDS